jgi:Zn-dependent peptidase ImmA (M78 family)
VRSVGGKKILKALDRTIAKYSLHSGANLLQPVNLERMLEAFWVEFEQMQWRVQALMMRKPRGRWNREYVAITLNAELKEDWASHRRRHAKAHEYGHVIADHKGSIFVMKAMERMESREGEDDEEEPDLDLEVGSFDGWIETLQEKESEEVAAYLLVPGRVLRETPGMERWYIARMLDVPEHLVKIRGEMLQKGGR